MHFSIVYLLLQQGKSRVNCYLQVTNKVWNGNQTYYKQLVLYLIPQQSKDVFSNEEAGACGSCSIIFDILICLDSSKRCTFITSFILFAIIHTNGEQKQARLGPARSQLFSYIYHCSEIPQHSNSSISVYKWYFSKTPFLVKALHEDKNG